jgi:hypothetical protein
VGLESARRGQVDRRVQHGQLVGEPQHGGAPVRDRRRDRLGHGRDRRPERIQQQRAMDGRTQIVIQHPPERLGAYQFRVALVSQLGRVRPKEVMHSEPPGGVGRDQV